MTRERKRSTKKKTKNHWRDFENNTKYTQLQNCKTTLSCNEFNTKNILVSLLFLYPPPPFFIQTIPFLLFLFKQLSPIPHQHSPSHFMPRHRPGAAPRRRRCSSSSSCRRRNRSFRSTQHQLRLQLAPEWRMYSSRRYRHRHRR